MSLLLKECRWCGNSFVPVRFNDLYCSDGCRREKDDERRKSKYSHIYYRKTKCLSDGVPTIPDVVSSTIEYKQNTGKIISYGKMVAMMERSGV